MTKPLSDNRTPIVNKDAHSEYDEMIVSSLLEVLRIEGQLKLDKFTRSELARAGLPASDLRRAVNLAGARQRVRTFAQNGVPCIALAESERAT